MNVFTRFKAALLGCCLLLVGGLQPARASHAQGGQLTYEYMRTNPNGTQTYRVTCRFFRDCSGIAAPTSLTLNCRNTLPTVCSGGTTVTATLMPGFFTVGSPYCGNNPGGSSPCGTTIANYESASYEGTVDLVPAANWTLSVEENSRPNTANLNTAGTLRLEATLNSLLTLPNGQTQVVANTSAQYLPQDIPVPFVCWQQRSTVSFSATEPDGDSLVYNLDRPMSSCNSYDTYGNHGVGNIIILSQQPPCIVAGLPSGPYTATFPLPSFSFVGSCPTKTASAPNFNFNATAGTFSFTPALFDATSPPSDGRNKYVVIGKVTEYRRLPGSNRRYLVGSVRRDFLVIVIDCGTNIVPSPPTGTVVTAGSGASIRTAGDTTELTVRTCNYARVSFRFTDPNPGQLLTVTLPANINTDLLQATDIGSFALTGNGTTAPVGTFFFQPSPATAGTIVRIPFRIEDNACPIKGVQNKVVVVKVVPGNYALALAALGGGSGGGTVAFCGGSLAINGSVLRPDSVRQVASGRTVAQVYEYSWSVRGNGLAASQMNSRNITVTPTQTSRYFLRITPTIGFGTNGGGCGDTTSILVRVAASPTASITASSPAVCPGMPVTLNAGATRADNLPDTYAYAWSGPGLAAGTSGQSIVVYPSATSTYTLTATGNQSAGCVATQSLQVLVEPGPPVPTITRSGNTLSSSASTGNQWHLNGQPIPGATGQTLQATASGTYTVVVTVAVGTTTCRTSGSLPVLITGSLRPLAGTSLSVVPNPTADGRLSVVLTGYQQPVELTLLDVLGRSVRQVSLAAPNPQGSTVLLDIADAAAGIYILQVRTKGGLDLRRIVRE